ncbi:hypothetical protein ACVPOS_17345 [Staphylococcus aureus]
MTYHSHLILKKRKINFTEILSGKLCMKYELKINDKKTEVNDFPYIHPQNKDFIFNYFKNYSSNSKDETWIIGIKNFIDLCIDEERKGNKGAIKVFSQ